jgi:hypothetical protein
MMAALSLEGGKISDAYSDSPGSPAPQVQRLFLPIRAASLGAGGTTWLKSLHGPHGRLPAERGHFWAATAESQVQY